GVLAQAKQDIRRFRSAQDAIGREIYADAYSWVASNDFSWPYSFLNVCEALGASPELLREDLLPDIKTSWYSRSRRVAQKISCWWRGRVTKVLGSQGGVASSRRSSQAVLAH